MIDILMLLSVAALEPSFSFSNPEKGEFEADICSVKPAERTEETLASLMTEESSELERSTRKMILVDGDELIVTTLRGEDGIAKSAYLYRLDLTEDEKKWVCRVRFDPNWGAGLVITMRWCISFIGGDAYRPTVKIGSN